MQEQELYFINNGGNGDILLHSPGDKTPHIKVSYNADDVNSVSVKIISDNKDPQNVFRLVKAFAKYRNSLNTTELTEQTIFDTIYNIQDEIAYLKNPQDDQSQDEDVLDKLKKMYNAVYNMIQTISTKNEDKTLESVTEELESELEHTIQLTAQLTQQQQELTQTSSVINRLETQIQKINERLQEKSTAQIQEINDQLQGKSTAQINQYIEYCKGVIDSRQAAEKKDTQSFFPQVKSRNVTALYNAVDLVKQAGKSFYNTAVNYVQDYQESRKYPLVSNEFKQDVQQATKEAIQDTISKIQKTYTAVVKFESQLKIDKQQLKSFQEQFHKLNNSIQTLESAITESQSKSLNLVNKQMEFKKKAELEELQQKLNMIILTKLDNKKLPERMALAMLNVAIQDIRANHGTGFINRAESKWAEFFRDQAKNGNPLNKFAVETEKAIAAIKADKSSTKSAEYYLQQNEMHIVWRWLVIVYDFVSRCWPISWVLPKTTALQEDNIIRFMKIAKPKFEALIKEAKQAIPAEEEQVVSVDLNKLEGVKQSDGSIRGKDFYIPPPQRVNTQNQGDNNTKVESKIVQTVQDSIKKEALPQQRHVDKKPVARVKCVRAIKAHGTKTIIYDERNTQQASTYQECLKQQESVMKPAVGPTPGN